MALFPLANRLEHFLLFAPAHRQKIEVPLAK